MTATMPDLDYIAELRLKSEKMLNDELDETLALKKIAGVFTLPSMQIYAQQSKIWDCFFELPKDICLKYKNLLVIQAMLIWFKTFRHSLSDSFSIIIGDNLLSTEKLPRIVFLRKRWCSTSVPASDIDYRSIPEVCADIGILRKIPDILIFKLIFNHYGFYDFLLKVTRHNLPDSFLRIIGFDYTPDIEQFWLENFCPEVLLIYQTLSQEKDLLMVQLREEQEQKIAEEKEQAFIKESQEKHKVIGDKMRKVFD